MNVRDPDNHNDTSADQTSARSRGRKRVHQAWTLKTVTVPSDHQPAQAQQVLSLLAVLLARLITREAQEQKRQSQPGENAQELSHG